MYCSTKIFCVLLVLTVSNANAGGEEAEDPTLKAFVGTWKVSGSAAGLELDGTFVAKWGSSKACLVSDYRFTLGGTPVAGNHVFGLDSATESYRVLGFFSNGTMEDYHYQRVSDGVYRGKYAGARDGQRFEGDLLVTVSEDSIKFQSSGLKRAGEPHPELSATLTRIRK